MRLILAVFAVVIAGLPAHAGTVWNVKIATPAGGTTQLTIVDGKPDTVLPSCRCVTGVWRRAAKGETATHFVGTLEALSFNHPRKAGKTLRVRVRKTRALLGVHKDYRDTLHGIMRDSGQLVLREVTGGEWEVAGFAAGRVGDLFAGRATWRAPSNRPPKPARPSPVVDPTADAAALAKRINDYRATLNLPRIPISTAMTKVAKAHVHDLAVHPPVRDRCNMHSWSRHGPWTPCCYDSSTEAARCMWRKPKEIAGHQGAGYEIAANASGITPDRALALWQQSPAHHAVMINQAQWTKPWRALGVAIEGDYAVAWFGETAD